jgi:amphiphysin
MPSVKSLLKKNISRTKEKILQGIGKTDKTSDENFDLYVENFERQYAQASKLNKELNRYLICLRDTQKSSRLFYETLKETYENEWPMSSEFAEQLDEIDQKWTEYLNRLYDHVQSPLMYYLKEFPDLKKKIEKRCNSLLDYDNARHTLENAQNKSSSSSKKNSIESQMFVESNSQRASSSSPSSNSNLNTSTITSNTTNTTTTTKTTTGTSDQLTKLTKLKIDHEDKQFVYEEMNQTLCLTLPVLFSNRVQFYSSLFQTFFHTETLFHSQALESKSKLDEICEKLSTKTVVSEPQTKKEDDLNNNIKVESEEKNVNEEENDRVKCDDFSLPSVSLTTDNITKIDLKENNNNLDSKEQDVIISSDEMSNENNHHSTSAESNEVLAEISNDDVIKPIKHIADRLMYKVKATYNYDTQESDELAFVKEDIIIVVEGSESEKEELDEGWLIGIHEATSRRGLFPENFTSRIS